MSDEESLSVAKRAYQDLLRQQDRVKHRAAHSLDRVQQFATIVHEVTAMSLELLGVAPHELAKTLRATISDLRTANAALTRAGVPLCLGPDGSPQVSTRVQWLIDARNADRKDVEQMEKETDEPKTEAP